MDFGTSGRKAEASPHDAVRALADGRVRIIFKAPTRQGATHVDVEPERFLARLVRLVPPPRQHQVRYFGVFSNHHALRSLLRPAGAPASATPPTQVPMFDTAGLRPWPPSTSHSQHRRVVTPRTLTEGAQGPHRLGQTTGARLCHRRHRLPTMRWTGAHHRCRPRQPTLPQRTRPSAILPAPSSARTLARSLSHCTHEPRLRYPLQTPQAHATAHEHPDARELAQQRPRLNSHRAAETTVRTYRSANGAGQRRIRRPTRTREAPVHARHAGHRADFRSHQLFLARRAPGQSHCALELLLARRSQQLAGTGGDRDAHHVVGDGAQVAAATARQHGGVDALTRDPGFDERRGVGVEALLLHGARSAHRPQLDPERRVRVERAEARIEHLAAADRVRLIDLRRPHRDIVRPRVENVLVLVHAWWPAALREPPGLRSAIDCAFESARTPMRRAPAAVIVVERALLVARIAEVDASLAHVGDAPLHVGPPDRVVVEACRPSHDATASRGRRRVLRLADPADEVETEPAHATAVVDRHLVFGAWPHATAADQGHRIRRTFADAVGGRVRGREHEHERRDKTGERRTHRPRQTSPPGQKFPIPRRSAGGVRPPGGGPTAAARRDKSVTSASPARAAAAPGVTPRRTRARAWARGPR
ncbi:MAG: transposase [Deltaproteobacteria bacterium]|nr:transposase [Deltaproteobacteria bacterium]